jgi:hypothetical protein
VIQVLLALLAAVPVGEKLTYRVTFGPLSAGTLVLQVAGIDEIRGESCYHLVSHLQSNPAYAILFSLDDTIETDARIRDFVTLRTRKHVQESRYENEVAADFDYDRMKVSYSDDTILDLCGESRDLLSLWYYYRSLDLAVGDTFSAYSHVDKRDYSAKVSVTGQGTVRTRAGMFDCLVIETASTLIRAATSSRASGGSVGNGTVYLEQNEPRLPVLIRTRMPFGYVTASLTTIEKGE